METIEEEPSRSPEPPSSNITADEIDEDTASKLRGDAIGTTMYSEKFVLSTLLQFSNLQWSSEVEDNLCFLWDMTEEQDMCQYLFKVSYSSLACDAIQNYTQPRFIEIVVGIFANLLCSKCEKNVKEEELLVVLSLLNSDDPYILIQVMRFLHAASYLFENLDFINEEHLEKCDFILVNSTNKELLSGTLKALAALTDERKLNKKIIKGNLLKSALIAYQILKEDCESQCEMFESPDKQLNVRHLMQLFCNLCAYANVIDRQIVDKLKENLDDFNKEVVLLLKYYKSEYVLLPLDDHFTFYIEALTYIYRVLFVNYISPVARLLYDVFLTLYRKDRSHINFVTELLCYFIFVGDLNHFRADFGNSSSDEIREILLYVEKNNYKFDFDYILNLRQILNAL